MSCRLTRRQLQSANQREVRSQLHRKDTPCHITILHRNDHSRSMRRQRIHHSDDDDDCHITSANGAEVDDDSDDDGKQQRKQVQQQHSSAATKTK